ncbi:hypothetical protein L798_10750 [Zootermopsis nevadensis]|uniref:Uncharacterized protein n=1 Tax=Zootermopsis nevadensis TaxID=136037 RepID=A0A067QWD0_ZOONE|nr:hypothetical protein L798_10750 [Zootermopsis nevadensis]
MCHGWVCLPASPLGHKFLVFAGECGLVQHLPCFARDKSRVTVDASYEAATVSGDGESRIRKELGGDRMCGHLFGAFKPDDG